MTGETLAPPRTTVGLVAWLRKNLFSSLLSSVMTGVMAGLLLLLAIGVAQWALTEARWDVVTRNLRLFLIGQYPADQAWRIWLSLLILSGLTGLSAGVFGRTTRALAIALSAVQAMLAALMAVSPVGPLITLGSPSMLASSGSGWPPGCASSSHGAPWWSLGSCRSRPRSCCSTGSPGRRCRPSARTCGAGCC
jgi:general L-amino acid transport system permease protein